MKTIQIQAHQDLGEGENNNEILRAAGVKRIHCGWYTVSYNGISPDRSTVASAKRNKGGELRQNVV